MKTARQIGKSNFAHIKCGNCGKVGVTYFSGVYGCLDCDCTTQQGLKFRTEIKLPAPTNTDKQTEV